MLIVHYIHSILIAARKISVLTFIHIYTYHFLGLIDRWLISVGSCHSDYSSGVNSSPQNNPGGSPHSGTF